MGEMLTILWPSHRQQLSDGVWNRLQENFHTDFVISVSESAAGVEHNVSAHLLILSIFCPSLKIVKKNVFQFDSSVHIDEDDLKYLLEFIYRGKIEVSVDKLENLKLAAEQLGLKVLVESIDKYLTGNRTDSTAAEKQYSKTESEDREKSNSKRKPKTPVKIPRKSCRNSNNEKKSDGNDAEDDSARSKRLSATKSKSIHKAKKLLQMSSRSRNPEIYESAYFNSVSQTCLLCDKQFKSKQIFRQHVRCHRDPNIMRQCPHCPAKIYSKTNLSNHIAWKHQMDLDGNLLEKKFKCDECDFVCVAEFQLKSHKGYKHGAKTQKCDQCSYSCRTHADLMKHKDGVHGELRPFMCDTCGFCTKTRSSFRLHLTIHQEKIPCDICGVLYKYRALSRHKRNAHCDNKKAFPCHICSYATKCKSYLKVHLAKVHKVSGLVASQVPNASESPVQDPSAVVVNQELYFGVNNSLQFDHSPDNTGSFQIRSLQDKHHDNFRQITEVIFS